MFCRRFIELRPQQLGQPVSALWPLFAPCVKTILTTPNPILAKKYAPNIFHKMTGRMA